MDGRPWTTVHGRPSMDGRPWTTVHGRPSMVICSQVQSVTVTKAFHSHVCKGPVDGDSLARIIVEASSGAAAGPSSGSLCATYSTANWTYPVSQGRPGSSQGRPGSTQGRPGSTWVDPGSTLVDPGSTLGRPGSTVGIFPRPLITLSIYDRL